MFNIRYTFKKGGPEYSKDYPDPKDTNYNIYIINGKNDRGKSTLLQMVALGLYGQYSNDITEILRERIKRLISEDTEVCEFNFKLENERAGIKIESSLQNGKKEAVILVNGKEQPRQFIENQFKILLDTPEEPIKKLSSALKSIQFSLHKYQSYTERYLSELSKLIERIESYEDKEKRLKEEVEKLNSDKESLNNIKDRLVYVNANFSELESARIVISYKDLQSEIIRIEGDMEELDKRITRLESQGAGGGSRKYQGLINNFLTLVGKLKFSVNTSASTLNILDEEDKNRLKKIVKEIRDVFTLNDINDDRLRNWFKVIEGLIEKIEKNPTYHKKLPEEDGIRLINSLMPVLKEFIDINTIIPGTNGKTVNQFINELEHSKKELETKISEKLIFSRAHDSLHDISKYLGEVASVYASIPKSDIQLDDQYDEIIEQLDSLDKFKNKKSIELQKIKEEYDKIPHSKREELLEQRENVSRNFNSLKKDKEILEQKQKELEQKVVGKEQFIKALEEVKQSPVSEMDKPKIKSDYKRADAILRKISLWLKHIDKINLVEMKVKEEDADSHKFYLALGEYFAELLKVVYFENQSWKLKNVDLTDRCYIVDERQPIRFVDIGTGHTALNALLARLKQDYGKKRKIVLIDEIGDMDQENLERLLKEIKEQIKEGKILLALLTRAENSSDEVNLQPVELS